VFDWRQQARKALAATPAPAETAFMPIVPTGQVATSDPAASACRSGARIELRLAAARRSFPLFNRSFRIIDRMWVWNTASADATHVSRFVSARGVSPVAKDTAVRRAHAAGEAGRD
jgi:hypothetical protein